MPKRLGTAALHHTAWILTVKEKAFSLPMMCLNFSKLILKNTDKEKVVYRYTFVHLFLHVTVKDFYKVIFIPCWESHLIEGNKLKFIFLQFLQQYNHYKSNVEIFKLQPNKPSKELAELVMFMAQVRRYFLNNTKTSCYISFAEYFSSNTQSHSIWSKNVI